MGSMRRPIYHVLVAISVGRQAAGRARAGYTRRVLGVCLATFCLSLALASPSAQAGTSYVDGISDQSLPHWDKGFSEFFSPYWVGDGHIRYARYFTPWNVMKAGNSYYSGLSEWYTDAKAMGLTPVIALTTLGSPLPSSSAEYKEYVEKLLAKFPVPYLEAWNEPNGGGGPSAASAAEYWTKANTACSTRSCTAIAGDFLDSQSNLVEYEIAYVNALGSSRPSIWGFHPYYSVKERDNQPTDQFVSLLPGEGSGAQIWFTEVGAYKCEYVNGKKEEYSEETQASRAEWLTNSLMPEIKPTHVFYYEFMYKEGQSPLCNSESADTALYVPSSDPYAPNAPRAAAGYIFGNTGVPAGYTGEASAIQPQQATFSGSVYPGGENTAKYHFEYGTSPSYGVATSEGTAGSNYGRSEANSTVSGLSSGTTYHYRIVAWNIIGSNSLGYGVDKTFTTPGPVEAVTGAATGVQQTQATLNGTVNPRGYDAKYYFQYGTSTGYGSSTAEGDAGGGTGGVPESVTVVGLEPGTVYHYRLVGTSGGVISYGADQTLTTIAAGAPSAVRESGGGTQWIYYIANNNDVCLWGLTSIWTNFCPGGGQPPARGTSPAVMREEPGGIQWIYYVGSNSELCLWGLANSTWTN
jgi:hypothetical protein